MTGSGIVCWRGTTDLKDSHIICCDINGIGKKLGEKDGMGLVKIIKETYPWKKIILYSSRSQHDTFHSAIGLADRRLPKDGQIYPFVKAIEELSREIFDWNTMTITIYKLVKNDIPSDLSFELFQKKIRSIVFKKKIDVEFIMKFLSTTSTTAKIILFIVGFFK